MTPDNPAMRAILRRSVVARIATLSGSGRPTINPLYFVYLKGRIWLGTATWTLAARNVTADPRVSVLFAIERNPRDRRVLRISGRASVRTDREAQRSYNLRIARKYILTPGGVWSYLSHVRQLALMRRYHRQSAAKGPACVIEVIPEHAELLDDAQ